jgi:ATP-dependent Lon protease
MARFHRSKPSSPRKTGRALRASSGLERVTTDGLRPAKLLPLTGLPPEVARRAQREMDRLRRLPPGSPDATQVRAYLQWLWALPWKHQAPEDVDLKQVEATLDRDHLGLAKAKERIVEYLAVRRLKPDLPGPALCLVGPPGTGKSSLAAAVAHALKRPFVRLGVSGAGEVGGLRGTPRGLPGAQPGKIVVALREAGVRNPVIMIDGVDRLAGETGLGAFETLLELLDPASSAHFTDQYLGLPLDLSHAVMVLCANNAELVPEALQDRLEVIEVPGYGEDEKLEIARRFLVPRLLREHGLAPRDLRLTEDALRAAVRHYTLEAGVRGLSRQIATVCRKVARARATGDTKRHIVTPRRLERYLGHRLFTPETAGKTDEVGVAAGLAWTVTGGEILIVEALKMPGGGRVLTTGQLGEVMKESVQAAHSYVRARADMLEIDAEAFANYDIHIHFPAAGVPKDGPSAGITVGLVIASVLSDRPIRHDVTMTGEVSLRGKVLGVGGIREKALAALRAGFRAMLYPAVNEKDVGDIPRDVRDRLELVPVETMDDVFAVALHRVILPKRIGDEYVIEVDEDDVLPDGGAEVEDPTATTDDAAEDEEAAAQPPPRPRLLGPDGNEI